MAGVSSRQYPIFTKFGWREIVDVEVGQSVMTHVGRFRKVTKIVREWPQNEMCQLASSVKKIKGGGQNIIVVESDTLIFLNDYGWVNAGSIIPKDLVRFVFAKKGKNPLFRPVEITRIKQLKNRPKRTISLEVEEDNSYVVKGFLIQGYIADTYSEVYKI